jgi:hypothetical protein
VVLSWWETSATLIYSSVREMRGWWNVWFHEEGFLNVRERKVQGKWLAQNHTEIAPILRKLSVQTIIHRKDLLFN